MKNLMIAVMVALSTAAHANEFTVTKDTSIDKINDDQHVFILKDDKYGCEYLVIGSGGYNSGGGITPRLGSCSQAPIPATK